MGPALQHRGMVADDFRRRNGGGERTTVIPLRKTVFVPEHSANIGGLEYCKAL